jgi:hypothetical protein
MAYVQKQRGKYRARFPDPLGNVHSRTFARKADAERFLRQLEVDRIRGQWIDPRNADMPVGVWAEEFLLLCRRLARTTQETYRRDLDKYVLPLFGFYRLGQLPADEIAEAACSARLPGGGKSPTSLAAQTASGLRRSAGTANSGPSPRSAGSRPEPCGSDVGRPPRPTRQISSASSLSRVVIAQYDLRARGVSKCFCCGSILV